MCATVLSLPFYLKIPNWVKLLVVNFIHVLIHDLIQDYNAALLYIPYSIEHFLAQLNEPYILDYTIYSL